MWVKWFQCLYVLGLIVPHQWFSFFISRTAGLICIALALGHQPPFDNLFNISGELIYALYWSGHHRLQMQPMTACCGFKSRCLFKSRCRQPFLCVTPHVSTSNSLSAYCKRSNIDRKVPKMIQIHSWSTCSQYIMMRAWRFQTFWEKS